MPEYEQFDDFLEMVIEFGYITMFASSFPLASALSVACNLIEIKSDCYKLAYVTQRPKSVRSQDIGVWGTVVQTQAFMAVLTNVLLFGFASEQMKVQICPARSRSLARPLSFYYRVWLVWVGLD